MGKPEEAGAVDTYRLIAGIYSLLDYARSLFVRPERMAFRCHAKISHDEGFSPASLFGDGDFYVVLRPD